MYSVYDYRLGADQGSGPDMQYLKWGVVMACVLAMPALAQENVSTGFPDKWAAYLAESRRVEDIEKDPEKRCLAYPDIPGNEWPEGAAKARCPLLRKPMLSLEEIENRTRSREGRDSLEEHFSTLLNAHFDDPAQREQIFLAYEVFDAGSNSERIANLWLKNSSDSPYARAALGRVYAQQGWQARGTAYARSTPEEQLQTMGERFESALPLLTGALEREKRLLPACVELAAIGRMSSDQLQKWALAKCMEIDSASYYVVEEMISAAQPKWGGSEEALRSVVAYATAHGRANPMLYVFSGYLPGYASEASDGWGEAVPHADAAVKMGPNARFLGTAAKAYLATGDVWAALAYVLQANRFRLYPSEWNTREHVLSRLELKDWLIESIQWRMEVDNEDGLGFERAGVAFMAAGVDSRAEAAYRRAMEFPTIREKAFEGLCSLLAKKGLEEQRRCSSELVAEYPGNAHGWALQMFSLQALGDDAAAARAFDMFVAKQDPGRWPQHKVAADIFQRMLESKKKEEEMRHVREQLMKERSVR